MLNNFQINNLDYGYDLLFTGLILTWIGVVVGFYQRIFEIPKWFASPPPSFEMIRKQSRRSRSIWIPLSVLFIISVCVALIFDWQLYNVRKNLIIALGCYGLTVVLSGAYFIRELIAFTNITVDARSTPEIHGSARLWLRWTTLRDILQLLAAVFITIAYLDIRGS